MEVVEWVVGFFCPQITQMKFRKTLLTTDFTDITDVFKANACFLLSAFICDICGQNFSIDIGFDLIAFSFAFLFLFFLLLVFIFFFVEGDGPGWVGVVAAFAGVPEDAVERVFVDAIDVAEIHLDGFLRPVELAEIGDRAGFRVDLIERDVVGDDFVRRKIELIREATGH